MITGWNTLKITSPLEAVGMRTVFTGMVGDGVQFLSVCRPLLCSNYNAFTVCSVLFYHRL